MKVLDIEPVYDGKFLHYYNFLLDDERKYEVVSRKNENDLRINLVESTLKADAVTIIALNETKDKICLIKEWRAPIGKYIYSFPAGLREGDENYFTTAERELFEETGLQVINLHTILPPSCHSIGMSDEAVATVICQATGNITNKNNTKDEDITPLWLSKEQVKELLLNTRENFSSVCQIFLAFWIGIIY